MVETKVGTRKRKIKQVDSEISLTQDLEKTYENEEKSFTLNEVRYFNNLQKIIKKICPKCKKEFDTKKICGYINCKECNSK